ncbi:sugar porter family MFS transporter, partial [Thioclava sp. BHET1]
RLGTMQQMAIVVGIFLALLVSALLAFYAGGAANKIWFGLPAWRWMFLSLLPPAILYGLLAIGLPESPRYLVESGRLDAARSVLANLVGIRGDRRLSGKIEEIRSTLGSEKRSSLSDLAGGRYGLRSVVWVGIILAVFQQLVGINVIFYYSTTLWQSVGFTESDSFLISVISSVVNIIATVIAIYLIDRVGRRRLLLAGSVIMAVTLGMMALCFSHSVQT